MSHRFGTAATWDLLNVLPDAVLVFNDAGKIHAANERAATLFKGTLADLIGRSRQDLAFPEHVVKPGEPGQPESTFAALVTLSGEPFSAWIRSAPMQDGLLQATSIRQFPHSGSVTIDPEMSILETLSEGVLIVDRDGLISYINLAARRMIGLDEDDPIQNEMQIQELFSPHNSGDSKPWGDHHFIDQVLSGGVPLHAFEVQLRTRGNASLDVSLNATALVSAGRKPNGAIVSIQDISRQKHAELQIAIQKQVLDMIADGRPVEETSALIVEYLERVVPGTRAALYQLDRETRDISVIAAPDVPEPVIGLLLNADGDPVAAKVLDSLVTRQPLIRSIANANRRPDDFDATLQASGCQSFWCYPVDPVANQSIGVIGLFRDRPGSPDLATRSLIDTAAGLLRIALDRVQIERDLKFQSFNDDLTGLPNRILLLDRLDMALQRAAQSDYHVAVLLLDIDQFHIVNNNLGHQAGDDFLRQAAQRLQESVRSDDLVARYIGDSFAILLDRIATEADAVNVVMRIQRAFGSPMTIADVDLYATVGIGIALAPDSGTDADTVVRYADIALSRAKEIGQGQFAIFSDHQDQSGVPTIELQTRLHRALAADALDLHFQPVMSLLNHEVTGYESLVRWHDAQFGSVAPDVFLPLAKQSGIMSEITAWVLDCAASQLVQWRETLNRDLFCSVNISPEEMNDPLLIEQIEAVIDRYQLEPSLLILEVTEHALVDTGGTPSRILSRLRELGVRIALDDFGTGFSSLAYLEHLAVDVIKIDGTFIHAARGGASRAPVATAMVDLARRLGMVSIAEGIETEEDERIARRIGCDLGQGYFYGRPQAAPQITPAG